MSDVWTRASAMAARHWPRSSAVSAAASARRASARERGSASSRPALYAADRRSKYDMTSPIAGWQRLRGKSGPDGTGPV